MATDVQIQATYAGDQPILLGLEGCLDPELVLVRGNEFAVKAFIPLELLVTAASIHAFEKLVLDPLLNPLAERFNWATAARKLLRPQQPVNVTVRILDNNYVEAPLGVDHEVVAQVWSLLRNAIDILKAEGHHPDVRLIRITDDAPGRPLVIAYVGVRPTWVVDTAAGRCHDVNPKAT